MDSFGAFSTEGEWDLCSSILSLEQLDFTPHCLGFQGLPSPTPPTCADGAAAGISDAWFCSLDSFTAGNLPYVFEATSRDHENNNSIFDQVPRIADDHHISMSSGAGAGAIDEKKFETIFSACSDMLLQEITAFSGEERIVNMDIDAHESDNAGTPANVLHHKRKPTDEPADDDLNKLTNANKKVRTSSNVQKTRKAAHPNVKTSQKLSTRRRKCEEEENAGSDMHSCSSDNSSEDDNASQETNEGPVLEGEASPTKGKTRASRGSATDSQSLYARKRRERINERLKILQKLVPNGTKVDISTMLEEAVDYVKFLQLQIKLLSSDELWMYAPIAYNGMDIGLQQKLSPFF